MDYSHKIYKANDIKDPPPTRGQYDEEAVRRGARELIAQQRRRDALLESARAEVAAEMAALKAENERLNVAIKELEREGLEPYRGFKNFDAYASAREWAESPHSDGQDGRMDNTSGAWAHLV